MAQDAQRIHPQMYLKDVEMWYFESWFSGGLGSAVLMVGLSKYILKAFSNQNGSVML